MKKHIRISAKAIIIREGRLLVLRKNGNTGAYAVTPGGGQQLGELLPEALRRECEEEINTPVKVGRLLFIREYIPAFHEFAAEAHHSHQLEVFFACEVPDDYIAAKGSDPDPGQESVEWVRLEDLEAVNYYPKVLIPLLQNPDLGAGPVYLGECN